MRFIQNYLKNIEWENTDFPEGLLKSHPYTGACPPRCSDLDEEFNDDRVHRATEPLIKHRIVNRKDVTDAYAEFWS